MLGTLALRIAWQPLYCTLSVNLQFAKLDHAYIRNVTVVPWHHVPCISLVPRPHPCTLCVGKGKGLGQSSVFLVFASSAVVFSRKPIRSQLYSFHVTLHPVLGSNAVQCQLSWFTSSQSECSSTILHSIA